MEALRQIDSWGADNAAAAVVRPEGVVARHGSESHVFRWASVTKLATALAVLVAVEEGVVDLDEPAGPDGATVRHLLAHASGLPFHDGPPIAPVGRRRIYSNQGFEALAAHVAERAEMPFERYLAEAVFRPLGMSAELRGSAGADVHGTLADAVALARELLAPTLVADETLAEATTVAFPGLVGVLPDYGRFDPLDWGLGFELKDGKEGHWSGTLTSPRTFGHFGGAGTFLWVDPELSLSLVVLTDREFGEWSKTAWPALSDAVVREGSRAAAG
ncbi:MAG: serine hydrolase domain-containing protein [Gaiellaceae bacterium]